MVVYAHNPGGWEVEAGEPLESSRLRPTWATQQDLVSKKKQKN
jgi:hypothetical protein